MKTVETKQLFKSLFTVFNKDRVGAKDHVCSFPQAVDEVVTVLFCLSDNVNVVQMVGTFKTRADGDIQTKTFVIKKSVVMKALVWLKCHNPEHQHATIEEKNLSLMGDNEDEAELPNVKEIITECDEEEAMKEHL